MPKWMVANLFVRYNVFEGRLALASFYGSGSQCLLLVSSHFDCIQLEVCRTAGLSLDPVKSSNMDLRYVFPEVLASGRFRA